MKSKGKTMGIQVCYSVVNNLNVVAIGEGNIPWTDTNKWLDAKIGSFKI